MTHALEAMNLFCQLGFDESYLSAVRTKVFSLSTLGNYCQVHSFLSRPRTELPALFWFTSWATRPERQWLRLLTNLQTKFS